MAEDRYIALKSAMGEGMNRELLQSGIINTLTFRDTVLEIPNDMELGAFIRKWINKNPENGLNIKYLNTEKCQQ